MANPGSKEPWQMTRAEFRQAVMGGKLYQGTGPVLPEGLKTAIAEGEASGYPSTDIAAWYVARRSGLQSTTLIDKGGVFKVLTNPTEQGIDIGRSEYIADALSEGKPVPPEVLADYPDLKATTGTRWQQAQAQAIARIEEIESEWVAKRFSGTTKEQQARIDSAIADTAKEYGVPESTLRRAVLWEARTAEAKPIESMPTVAGSWVRTTGGGRSFMPADGMVIDGKPYSLKGSSRLKGSALAQAERLEGTIFTDVRIIHAEDSDAYYVYAASNGKPTPAGAKPAGFTVVEYDRQYSLSELKSKARAAGVSISGDKKALCRKLMDAGVL